MIQFTVKDRPTYLNRLMEYATDHDMVFVTGVRRSGKTCIAIQLAEALKAKYGSDAVVARYNFEAVGMKDVTVEYMENEFHKYYQADKPFFIILDEMTHMRDWEDSVNKVYEHANCKLFLFSSKEEILSDKFTAVQRGEYHTMQVFPLSLNEYLSVQDFRELTAPETPVLRKQFEGINGATYNIQDVYGICTRYGCLAVAKPEYLDREHMRVVLDGSYSSIVLRDIAEVDRRGGEANITDLILLRNTITTLADSIGNNVSSTWISKQILNGDKRKPATKTVESYIKAFLNAHLFYESPRYDIKNQCVLKTLSKFYIVDIGLHNYLANMADTFDSRVLESRVFFELLRRGYTVYNGKYGRDTIDFVAMKGDELRYIQIVDHLTEDTSSEILSPLRKIRDFHPKTVISFDETSGKTHDGILLVNALEFLMGGSL